MRIENPKLLAELRVAGPCEVCGKPCRRREVAHVRARGHADGHRMDIRLNLVSCGLGAWSGMGECHCHLLSGLNPAERTLFKIVAKRELVTADEVEHALFVLDRLPKDASQRQLERTLDGVPMLVAQLVIRELRELPDYWRRIEPLPGRDCCKVEMPF